MVQRTICPARDRGLLLQDLGATVTDYAAIDQRVIADPRYQRHLDWGEPRPGHPEGTLQAHIAELERNLERLRPRLSETEVGKLRLLIHVHDTFKPEAAVGVAIADPRSHASLARAFLAEFCDDADLLAMVQYHDEPFALLRHLRRSGDYRQERMQALWETIGNWDLFLAFTLIDGCTAGKSREPLQWFFGEIAGHIESRFTAADILP